MKKIALTCCAVAALAAAAFAGPEYGGKEMEQVTPPLCPQWYADYEWNVDLWGTYLFTGNDWADDRYIESDHAWGGGMDVKYFLRRYFGVGVEGYVVDANRAVRNVEGDPLNGGVRSFLTHDSRAVGSVLGTFTLRYPIGCSRLAPYIFAGGGAIFGGGERDKVLPTPFFTVVTEHTGSQTEAIGQFGAGIEVRITPHIGWMSDFSWNVVDGSDDNFGMVRSGITFAF
jgi:hypothetical protein